MKKTGLLDPPELEGLLSEVIKSYKEMIQEQLVEIVLFGSYARGNQEEYSDVDIVVLIDDSDENIKRYDKLLEDFNYRLTMKYEILVSPIMIRFELFKQYMDVLPFYMNIINEGLVVYERRAA